MLTKLGKLTTDYYKELYQSSSRGAEAIKRFLEGLTLSTLSAELREELEAPIALEETRLAISSMRGNTSPGLNGLIIEFDKKF